MLQLPRNVIIPVMFVIKTGPSQCVYVRWGGASVLVVIKILIIDKDHSLARVTAEMSYDVLLFYLSMLFSSGEVLLLVSLPLSLSLCIEEEVE